MPKPITITSVEPRSHAARAGVRAGESLVSINGHSITDCLDFGFYSADDRLELVIEGAGGARRTVRMRGGETGLGFESYLMDKQRCCANGCLFCFIDQLPKGMRESLYFKDDDDRMSFLRGSYVTLTNLSEAEIARITQMHLSPINVSVHATDPEVRRKLLRNRFAGSCLDTMKRFAAAGIEMNCQVVVCPGLNDGSVLEMTIHDLLALSPAVRSIAVVPVGLTAHREGLYPLEPVTKERAKEILSLVRRYAGYARGMTGGAVVFASDEIYIKAEEPMPEPGEYEDFPQLENGVGMIALLQKEFRSALEATEPENNRERHPFIIVTGEAAAPFIKNLLDETAEKCNNIEGEVFAVKNNFFGPEINVAGLVTGGDIIKQLSGRKLPRRMLIPSVMLRAEQDVFLDGVAPADIERALGVEISVVQSDGARLLDEMLK